MVEAPERDTTRCAAAIRTGRSAKNAAQVADDTELGILRRHRVDVLGAGLLDNMQPRANGAAEQRHRRRHDFRHHPRALAATEDEQPDGAVAFRRYIGHVRGLQHQRPHPGLAR